MLGRPPDMGGSGGASASTTVESSNNVRAHTTWRCRVGGPTVARTQPNELILFSLPSPRTVPRHGAHSPAGPRRNASLLVTRGQVDVVARCRVKLACPPSRHDVWPATRLVLQVACFISPSLYTSWRLVRARGLTHPEENTGTGPTSEKLRPAGRPTRHLAPHARLCGWKRFVSPFEVHQLASFA
jgi:hypothetical protein